MLTRPSSQRGFSLVEVMTVVAVTALVLGLAMPSFHGMVQSSRIKGASEAVRDGIELARIEAIKRNRAVQLVFDARGQPGWKLTLPPPADDTVLQQRSGEETAFGTSITFTPDSHILTFDAFGRRLSSNADGSPAVRQLDIAASANSDAVKNLRVLVSDFGVTKICDPSAPAQSISGC